MPERIGKYTITHRIGRGATSEVFRAFDPFRSIDVAIKVMNQSVFESEADPLTKSSFMVEASLVGKLDHPHVARIYDVVDEPGLHYVVMEYAGGGTLEKYCEPGSLMDIDSAVDVVFKCGKALEYVHGLGIVHRDIKPANILLAEATNVKVADFGAALNRALSSTQRLEVGSPYYMSPEQVENHEVDFRSDIYSLGVVMYQLLSGKLPFESGSIEDLKQQILERQPEPPSYYQDHVPRRLDTVLLKALQKKPEDRFQSWQQFLEDLTNVSSVATGISPSAPPASSSSSDRFQRLRRCKFFNTFPDEALWEVLEVAEFKRVPQGELIIGEGDLGDFFCVLLAGRVRVTKNDRLIDVLSPGSCFGELSYILENKVSRSASCVALSAAVVLTIQDQWLRDSSANCRLLFERSFLQFLSARLIDADVRLSKTL